MVPVRACGNVSSANYWYPANNVNTRHGHDFTWCESGNQGL